MGKKVKSKPAFWRDQRPQLRTLVHGVDATLDRDFFEGTNQIPAKKIDKSTSTINKFDLGHKNHEKTEFLRQQNLSTNLQKKIDKSTDKFGFLGHRFEICRHVDKFQICRSVDSSKNPQIDRSTINKFGFLGHSISRKKLKTHIISGEQKLTFNLFFFSDGMQKTAHD